MTIQGPDAGNGSAPLARPKVLTRTDRLDWPRRGEVAKALGYSVNKVRSLEQEGVLTPEVDGSGHHRFDPAQVEAVRLELQADELGQEHEPAPDQRLTMERESVRYESRGGGGMPVEAFALRSAVNLLITPRKDIDAYQARLMEYWERREEKLLARIEHLEERLSKSWGAEQDALDRSHLRKIVADEHSAESKMKLEALSRFMKNGEEALSRLLGKKGTPFLTSLTLDKLRAMMELNNRVDDDGKPIANYWSDAQFAAIQKALSDAEKLERAAQPAQQGETEACHSSEEATPDPSSGSSHSSPST